VKIDLRKDKGLLSPQKFLADDLSKPELSEDELIAETLRRRHSSHQDEFPVEESPEEAKPKKSKSKSTKKKKSSNRNPLREFVLLIIMVAVTAYYLNDKGILFSTMDMVQDYAYDLLGIDPVLPTEEDDLDIYDEYFSGDSLILGETSEDTVLSDDIFNELMPVTPELAALVDSLEEAKPDSIYLKLPDGRDTVIVYQEMTQVADDPVTKPETEPETLPVSSEKIVTLSDDDISIINNRSLLIMVTEMINSFPIEYGSGHLFLKRDALTITAPRGGEWVSEMQDVLDKFVQGSFIEDYGTGTAKITSKFELVMNADKDFEGLTFDAMRLLDILANPFDEYLNEIIIDPARGTDDSPVELSFSGSAQEMQFILSSWAESRSNYLIKSIDIDFQGEELHLQFGVIFFNYTP